MQANISVHQNFDNTPAWKKWMSAPFVYGMFLPSVCMHICAEIYHQVCFRLYGIPLLDVRKYIFIDRYKLKKLSTMQKINCMYCGYINGLYAYFVALASITEEYWCAVKHEKSDAATVQPQQNKFLKREPFL